MKKLLLILLLLLILGGGGAYYYFFMLAPQDESAEPPPPPPPDNRFVEMKSLRIPVMRGGVVVNYVVLHLTLETVGPDNEELTQSLLPRLRNAFLTDLHGYFATVSVEDRLMVKALKRRLQIISNRVLGPGTVNEVLIQKAFKQKG
ncbi:hypothetical protein [Pacificispira sp.]|uniref:hypothetical protein n=1 Tax=Pacificispira sp. TaxID=2888761 RepID=UPI003BAB0B5F